MICVTCGKKTTNYKFCSRECDNEYRYNQYISSWLNGEKDGKTGKSWIGVSGYIRRYLFNKFDNSCAICGWNKVNPHTGKIPLEIEHIDGDSLNNSPENLTLLCPNCHSLTSTYKALNKGNGTRKMTWIPK